jgi:threonine-phosphate decarboxylase
MTAHGGNIYEVAMKLGVDSSDILDFSANLNPLGYPKLLDDIIENSKKDIINYPDPDYINLTNDIKNYFKSMGTVLSDSNILPGNGATELIFLLIETLKPKKIYLPVPCFSEYEEAAKKNNGKVERIYLNETDGFDIRPDMFKYDRDCANNVIMLCSPNNPTSKIIKLKNMKEILRKASESNIIVILDETFIELTIGNNKNSAISLINEFSNLIIIRAFTKIFSMPGIRLGYVIAVERIIKKLKSRQNTWSINCIASNSGKLLFENAFFEETRKWLENEKDRFFYLLNEIEGIKPYYPESNFILIKILTETTSGILKEKLINEKILIRDASNFDGLDNKYIRLAIKDKRSNDILIEKFKKIFA